MWPFRRKVGRHELGAAVTAIPSVPLASVLSVYGAKPAPPAPPEPPPAPPEPPVVAAPRVELGFRDGSTASLAPGSAQAKALTDLAQVLTQRD